MIKPAGVLCVFTESPNFWNFVFLLEPAKIHHLSNMLDTTATKLESLASYFKKGVTEELRYERV